MRHTQLKKIAGPWLVEVFAGQVRIENYDDDRVVLGKVFDLNEARDLHYALGEIIRHAEAEDQDNRDRR
jgi:hypothetical protein